VRGEPVDEPRLVPPFVSAAPMAQPSAPAPRNAIFINVSLNGHNDTIPRTYWQCNERNTDIAQDNLRENQAWR